MRDSFSNCIAIVIPTLNEERHLPGVLSQLRYQAPTSVAELLIVDGGSDDSTRAIVAAAAREDPRIRLIDNPRKLQSAAMNLAAEQAQPDVDILIRADAHADYPVTFIDDLLLAAHRSGAESVVNQLLSTGTTCFQRAVAAVSNSSFGTGGATHRMGGTSGFVDHGHHALFRRDWFLRLGGYDESFVANEDAEYDVRLRAAGGRVWFTEGAKVRYFPRNTPRGLARQYYRYGKGRARTRRKHGEALRLRQLAPPIVLLACLLGLMLTTLHPAFALAPMLYMAGVLAATALLVARTGDRCVLGAALALPVMHFAWGAGFLVQSLSGRSR